MSKDRDGFNTCRENVKGNERKRGRRRVRRQQQEQHNRLLNERAENGGYPLVVI